MLTPQDIQSKEFTKAVFGGYDMASVDDFLEELLESYSALYKDNGVLKGKLKVLVEKVEEYRSTEDAMRMALLTAQKMSDELVEETQKKCDALTKETQEKCNSLLASATKEAEKAKTQFSAQFRQEQWRLQEAKAQTASFVRASKQVLEQYADFLSKLESAVPAETSQEEDNAPSQEAEPVRSPEPEPADRAPKAEPAKREPAAGASGEVEMDDTIRQIDDFVAGVMGDAQDKGQASQRQQGKERRPQERDQADLSAETRRIDPEQVAKAISQRSKDWNEEDELTTPRPKFDFSDLKFGKNYKDDDE